MKCWCDSEVVLLEAGPRVLASAPLPSSIAPKFWDSFACFKMWEVKK